MPSTLVLTMPGNEAMGASIAAELKIEARPIDLHRFPDGETCVTLPDGLAGQQVAIVCTLDHPDAKLAPLLFAADAARELGAAQVGLVAPYLAYMRQDARFAPGQAISARSFARLLGSHVDFLLTVDPHLHRIRSLDRVFSIQTANVAAAPAVAEWIARHIPQPLLIGPDGESVQWIAAVADRLDAPYRVLSKSRHGDADVEVSVLEAQAWKGYTPVLLDDIVSTARTMAAATQRLRQAGLPPPICIAVHPIFADDAVACLEAAGAARIVSCDSIAHPTNAIRLAPLLAQALQAQWR